MLFEFAERIPFSECQFVTTQSFPQKTRSKAKMTSKPTKQQSKQRNNQTKQNWLTNPKSHQQKTPSTCNMHPSPRSGILPASVCGFQDASWAEKWWEQCPVSSLRNSRFKDESGWVGFQYTGFQSFKLVDSSVSVGLSYFLFIFMFSQSLYTFFFGGWAL